MNIQNIRQVANNKIEAFLTSENGRSIKKLLQKVKKSATSKRGHFLENIRKGSYVPDLLLFLLGGVLFTEDFGIKMFLSGTPQVIILAWITLILLIFQLKFKWKGWWDEPSSIKPALLDDWDIPSNWDCFENGFEIALAPNIREPETDRLGGWKYDEIYMHDLGDFSRTKPELESYYEKWLENVKPEKLSKDGIKYVLVNDPQSLLDQHNLSLKFRKTRWSRVTSANQLIRDRETGRNKLFGLIYPKWESNKKNKPKISFQDSVLPTSFCLHGVVVTSDNRVLAIQRPNEEVTDYHPLTWSISFEEQLADQDFIVQDGISKGDAKKWLRRAVAQEILGYDHVDEFFSLDDARFMTLGIEEEIGNPFITAYIPVSCTSMRLPEYLKKAPDRGEISNYLFIDLSSSFDEAEEVLRRDKHIDGNGYHPTSKYRLSLLIELLHSKRLVI